MRDVARSRWASAVLAAAMLAVLAPAPRNAAALKFPSTVDEVKFGAQIAKEIASHYRAITNPAQVARLNRVGQAIARVVERQDLQYHFTILAIAGVNAVSIPGGWVYVTEGMMRFVRSDDELAAVVAHEMTHVNHRHYYIQADREAHMTPALVLAIALSVLARSPAPMLGAEISMRSVMNNYQRDLERDADLTGVSYLTRTGYSPVAMLTLLEHLAQLDRLTGQLGPTGLEDHPLPEQRVAYIRADLERLHIPISRRRAEGALRIALDPASPPAGAPVTIRVDDQPIVTLGATVDGQAPADRALALAVRFDKFFNRDPEPFDVRAVAVGDHWSLVGAEMVLFDVAPQDAQAAHMSQQAFADDIRVRLAGVIAAAPFNRTY